MHNARTSAQLVGHRYRDHVAWAWLTRARKSSSSAQIITGTTPKATWWMCLDLIWTFRAATTPPAVVRLGG
ncbi:hypothetical protein [Mycobacterium riyadhense]|uniref:hypothetical protein n=1 Tax=Mycobacterium riyadhense TaxID=486698 RepID=UPI00195CEB32